MIIAATFGITEAAVAGCGNDKGAGAGAADAARAAASQRVSSRDGVLTITLPAELLVHTQGASIFGTSADAKLRLYLRHEPSEKLIRVVGQAKDSLIKRGWEVTGERHFEKGVEVQSERGFKATRQLRASWFFRRAGRNVVCEAIARPDRSAYLGAAHRKRCLSVEVVAAPSPAEPAQGGAEADATP